MKRLGLLVGALLISGCAWWRGGPAEEPPATLTDFTPSATVRTLWTADIGAGFDKRAHLRLAPYADERAVYAVDAGGQVSAFAVDNGKLLWRGELGRAPSAGVGNGEGLLLFGSRKGEVIALEKEDGRVRWSVQVSSEVLGSPVAGSGIVVAQAGDGRVLGMSPKDGTILWRQDRSVPPLSLRGTASPLLVGDRAYVGFANGRLLAIQLAEGRSLWETAIAEPRGRNEIERLVDVDMRPVFSRGRVYAAAYQGKVAAVDGESGRGVWSRDLSTHLEMDHDQTNLYVTDEQGDVYALDLASGAANWRQTGLQRRRVTAPTDTGRYVAVGDFEGYVHWLSKEDGRFVARYDVGGSPIKAKALARDNVLFVLDQGGSLTALRIEP